jgi:hypothetical protein
MQEATGTSLVPEISINYRDQRVVNYRDHSQRVNENCRQDCAILEKEGAFTKTHDLIDRVAEHKGHGPYKWSWPKPSRKDQRRVDTEISHGLAFV